MVNVYRLTMLVLINIVIGCLELFEYLVVYRITIYEHQKTLQC